MTCLRILNLIAWLTVAAWFFPAVLRSLRGMGRAGDETRAGFFFVALLLTSFVSRWLFAPSNLAAMLTLPEWTRFCFEVECG